MIKNSHCLSRILFTLASVFFVFQSTAQESKEIFLEYGQTYNLKIDETYSRLAKKGNVHDFNFGYERIKSENILSVQARFVIGELNTDGNTVNRIDNYGGNLKLRFLKKTKSAKLSSYVGLLHDLRADIWFPKNNELRYAWDIYWGVGVSAKVFYNLSPKLLMSYTLDLPVIGVVWRSHNNGQQLTTEEIQLEKGLLRAAFETPRFAYLSNTTYVDNAFKTQFNLSEKAAIHYRLGLSYRSIKQPLLKKGYEITNAIGFHHRF